jgi:hypothetical protein
MHACTRGLLPTALRSPPDRAGGGNDQLLLAGEAAERLRVAKQTLARWRVEGQGPPFVRIGSRVLYRVADIDAYVVERCFRSTAEADRAARG